MINKHNDIRWLGKIFPKKKFFVIFQKLRQKNARNFTSVKMSVSYFTK